MPNLQKIETHFRRKELIQKSLKAAQAFMSNDAYLEMDGKRQLYTAAQLTELMKNEDEEIRKASQQG